MDELSGISIDDLLQLARDGDLNQLGQLLETYRSRMQQQVERQLGQALSRRVGASDIVQQSFLDAYRGFGEFQGSSKIEFAAWLNRILENNVAETIRNHTAVQKRALSREQVLDPGEDSRAGVAEDPQSTGASPSQVAIDSEQTEQITTYLETLPEDQQLAVRLRYLDGWSLDEIAAELDRSIVATAGLIKRGLQSLRQRMRQPRDE